MRLAYYKSITYSEANLGGGIRLLAFRSDRGRLYRERKERSSEPVQVLNEHNSLSVLQGYGTISVEY